MLSSKQENVQFNVSRLERGLAIMHDAPWMPWHLQAFAKEMTEYYRVFNAFA